MNPLISVIVPVYNVEEYLKKSIESILNQSFADFELILVNDGSTDESLLICNYYGQIDERVVIINKKNGGLSSARNAGLDVAKGKYICFIDSDDWIHTNMIKVLYQNMVDYNADISQCNLVKTRNEKITDSVSQSFRNRLYTNIEMLNRLHEGSNIINVIICNKLYKRELFNHIRFPQGKIHEDEYVNYKLFYRAKKIICTNQKLYYYRQRKNSIMGREFNLSRLDGAYAFMERIEFYNFINMKTLYQKEILHLLYYFTKIYPLVKKIPDSNKVLRKLRKLYRVYFIKLLKTGYKNKALIGYSINTINPCFYNMDN